MKVYKLQMDCAKIFEKTCNFYVNPYHTFCYELYSKYHEVFPFYISAPCSFLSEWDFEVIPTPFNHRIPERSIEILGDFLSHSHRTYEEKTILYELFIPPSITSLILIRNTMSPFKYYNYHPMNTSTFYAQVFTNLERGIPPLNRKTAIRNIFTSKMYTLSQKCPTTVSGFIDGEISYENAMVAFTAAIQEQLQKRRANLRVQREEYNNKECATYGPRSLPQYPEYLSQDGLKNYTAQLKLFSQYFGPTKWVIDDTIARMTGLL